LFSLTRPPRAGAPDVTRAGYRMWIIEADWFLVEREPSAAPLPDCWSVILDQHGVIYCTCPTGLQRIGCDHILAVGEQPQRELPDAVRAPMLTVPWATRDLARLL
jgi:hypothetical protein